MELKGEFKSHSEILDLFQIVSMGKKSGEVNLRSDSESITIFFRDGKVCNFISNVELLQRIKSQVEEKKISLEEALKSLLHYVALWSNGRFNFVEKSVDVPSIGSADTINVMMDFTKEVDELPEAVKELLKNDGKLSLREDGNFPVTVDESAWGIIVNVCRGRSIKEIAFSLPYPFLEIVRRIDFLMKNGLLEPAKEKEREAVVSAKAEEKEFSFVQPEKLEKIKELLVDTMGPMGEFLVEETLEEMDLSQLPVDRIPHFIEVLVDKIPDSCLIEGESCRDRIREQIKTILQGGGDVD